MKAAIRQLPRTSSRPRALGSSIGCSMASAIGSIMAWCCPRRSWQPRQRYRRDSDPIGRFLEACTINDLGAREQAQQSLRRLCAWAKTSNERESTVTYFGRALRDHGVNKIHSDGSFYLGIRLTRSVTDFVDHRRQPATARRSRHSSNHTGDDEFKA